jgi:hypothetical protein
MHYINNSKGSPSITDSFPLVVFKYCAPLLRHCQWCNPIIMLRSLKIGIPEANLSFFDTRSCLYTTINLSDLQLACRWADWHEWLTGGMLLRLLWGPSTRVRIRVRIAVRFRARFVRKQNRDPILFLSPITMVCLHILTKKTQKITCWALLAVNRTPNRTGIHMENRTCRRPLKGDGRVGFHAGKARKIKMPRGARKWNGWLMQAGQFWWYFTWPFSDNCRI